MRSRSRPNLSSRRIFLLSIMPCVYDMGEPLDNNRLDFTLLRDQTVYIFCSLCKLLEFCSSVLMTYEKRKQGVRCKVIIHETISLG